MAASFRCPKCQTIFRVEESALGKSVICPNPACGQKTVLPKARETNEKNPDRRIRRDKVAVAIVKESSAVIRELKPQPQKTLTKVESNWLSKDLLIIAGIGGVGMFLISILLVIVMFRSTSVEQSTNAPLNSPTSQTSETVAESDGVIVDDTVPGEPINNDEDSGTDENPSESPAIDESLKSDQVDRSEQADNRTHQSEDMTVEQVVAGAEKSVAFIEGRRGVGSGFVIRDKVIATNRHVIENELVEQLKIHFPSAQIDLRGPLPAELIYVDPEKDLAFLKVETAMSPLPTPTQHSFRRGQEVIAIGNPGSLEGVILQNAVSRGVVSTEVVVYGQKYYQLGMPINGGNSGGPILDMSGQVIGVATLRDPGKQALAFCVPLSDLNDCLQKIALISDSEINANRSRHRLGVVVSAISVMADGYSFGMRTYLKSIDEALSSGRSVESGLENVRSTVAEKLKGLDSWLIDSDLTREASRIMVDPNLSEGTREQFSDLWTNYKVLKSNVENPRGTVENFRSTLLQLSDKHERLMHALNLFLGVESE